VWSQFYARRPANIAKLPDVLRSGGTTVVCRPPADSPALRFRNEIFLSVGAPAPRAQYHPHQPPVGHFFLRYSLPRVAIGPARRHDASGRLKSTNRNLEGLPRGGLSIYQCEMTRMSAADMKRTRRGI
jgi:hypothetical protein